MSKKKRVMQQNTRAAFVLGVSVEEFFAQSVMPTLSERGILRVVKWGRS